MELYFPEPQSLKEKRSVLQSLTNRLRKKFNVAVAEIDGMDLWQSSVLGIAAVGNETKHVNQILDFVLDFVRAEREVEITKEHMEFF